MNLWFYALQANVWSYDIIIYWRFVKEKTMIRRNSKHGQMHLLTTELLVEQELLNADAFTTKSYLDFLQSWKEGVCSTTNVKAAVVQNQCKDKINPLKGFCLSELEKIEWKSSCQTKSVLRTNLHLRLISSLRNFELIEFDYWRIP